MPLDQLEQWKPLLKKDSALYHRVKVLVLLLTALAFAVLIFFSVNLAFLFYSSKDDINTRAIKAAAADSHKIDNMARNIERTVRDITLAASEKEFNENNLIGILSEKRSSVPLRYSISFLSDADSSSVSQLSLIHI